MNILEILVTFVDVIVESFCESYLAIVLFSFINKNDYLFFNRKGFSNFLKFWAINSVAFIANRALHIFLPDLNWLKPILFALITSCSTRLVYGIKFYKGLIVSILILIISAIFEVVLVLVLKCFNVVAEDIVQNIYYYSVYACSLAILKFGIAFVVYKTKTIVYRNIHGEENKLKYFMPQLIAVIVCLFPSMILLILNYYEYSAYFVFINLIQLLVVAFVGIYNLDFVIRHEHTEMELANTIIYKI